MFRCSGQIKVLVWKAKARFNSSTALTLTAGSVSPWPEDQDLNRPPVKFPWMNHPGPETGFCLKPPSSSDVTSQRAKAQDQCTLSHVLRQQKQRMDFPNLSQWQNWLNPGGQSMDQPWAKLPAALISSALCAPTGRLLTPFHPPASRFRRRSSTRLPPGEAHRSQQLPCLF